VETDAADGNRSERGFPQRLGKHKTLFHSFPTRPDGGSIIDSLFVGPKRGSTSNINSKCAISTVSTEGSPQRRVPLCVHTSSVWRDRQSNGCVATETVFLTGIDLPMALNAVGIIVVRTYQLTRTTSWLPTTQK